MLNKVSKEVFDEYVKDLEPDGQVYTVDGRIIAFRDRDLYYVSICHPKVNLQVNHSSDNRYTVFMPSGLHLGDIEIGTAHNPYIPGKLTSGCSFRAALRHDGKANAYIQQAYASILLEMDKINKRLSEESNTIQGSKLSQKALESLYLQDKEAGIVVHVGDMRYPLGIHPDYESHWFALVTNGKILGPYSPERRDDCIIDKDKWLKPKET